MSNNGGPEGGYMSDEFSRLEYEGVTRERRDASGPSPTIKKRNASCRYQ